MRPIASLLTNYSRGNDEVKFPALKELSLDSIIFDESEKELVHALNINNLACLTLRECCGWEELLTQALKAGQLDELASLEITYLIDGSDISCIWDLSKHTKVLKDLYISLLADSSSDRLNPFAKLTS